MRINTNVAAMNTLRILSSNQASANKNIGRLSSGFRINSAADDAAGLGIANKLRADVRSMKQASRNAEQASAMLQIAEGATQTIADILDRMKELATQAGSDNTDDAGRTRIMQEFEALLNEIGMIANTTKFQGKALLNGSFGNALNDDDTVSTALAATGVQGARISSNAASGTYTFTTDANKLTLTRDGTGVSQTIDLTAAGAQTVVFDQFGITVELDAAFTLPTDATHVLNGTALVVDAGSSGGSYLVRSSGDYTTNDLVSLDNLNLTTTALGLDDLGPGGSNFSTPEGTAAEWRSALAVIDSAISNVNSVFGSIGAAQNRIDYANQNLKTAIENFSAAESTIRDVDMAQEMTEFSKNQILLHSATAMLAQANQAPHSVLRLIA